MSAFGNTAPKDPSTQPLSFVVEFPNGTDVDRFLRDLRPKPQPFPIAQAGILMTIRPQEPIPTPPPRCQPMRSHPRRQQALQIAQLLCYEGSGASFQQALGGPKPTEPPSYLTEGEMYGAHVWPGELKKGTIRIAWKDWDARQISLFFAIALGHVKAHRWTIGVSAASIAPQRYSIHRETSRLPYRHTAYTNATE